MDGYVLYVLRRQRTSAVSRGSPKTLCLGSISHEYEFRKRRNPYAVSIFVLYNYRSCAVSHRITSKGSENDFDVDLALSDLLPQCSPRLSERQKQVRPGAAEGLLRCGRGPRPGESVHS